MECVNMDDKCEITDSSESDRASRITRPPLLPPCRICGGNASGFHYGVNTCEACKGFFRRSFGRAVVYKCAGNDDCAILPRRRNNCPACRMKKCLAEGMSKEAIKTGRYSYEKRTQYIEEVKSIGCKSEIVDTSYRVQGQTDLSDFDGQCDQSSVNQTYIPANCQTVASSDDVNIADQKKFHINDNRSDINQIASVPKYECEKTSPSSSSGQSTQNNFDVCKKARVSTQLDLENQSIVDLLLKSQDQHLEDLDSFLDEIKMKKRQKEFHHRVKLSMSQPECPTVDSQTDVDSTESQSTRMEQMMRVAEIMDSELRSTVSFIKAIPGWKTFDMEDQVNLIKDGAAELWILGHSHCIDSELGVFTGEYDMSYATAASVWTDDYVGCVYKTSKIFSSMALTKEELVVLKTIVLTFPDRSDLVNRGAVEKVQWRMIQCLKYVCEKNGKNFNTRFAQITNGLIHAREMTEKFQEIAKTVVSQWSVFKKYPLIIEFFTSLGPR
ncbi:hypothetical protein ACF0H5_015280 [Mactra antiquata]